jgi:hypothetical protein
MRSIVKRLLAASLVVVGAIVVVPATADASAAGTDGPGGSVTVGASDGGTSSGAPGTPGVPGGPGGGNGASGAGGSPWLCSYTMLTLNDEGGFAPGGPTPGSWYSVTCTNQSTGASTTQTEWIPDATSAQTPAIDPYSVARQAERSLQLPAPASQFDPAALSVVNLPTWLWIDAGIWHRFSVTASVGTVSATAVAAPTSVTWTMGDGGVTICNGPGTPYIPEQPSDQQSTTCDYTYLTSSDGQPSTDGNPNDDAYNVVATIDWSVTWSVQGAAGGGELPPLTTSSSRPVRVEQVESVNTELSSSDGRPSPGGSD